MFQVQKYHISLSTSFLMDIYKSSLGRENWGLEKLQDWPKVGFSKAGTGIHILNERQMNFSKVHCPGSLMKF